MYREGVLGRILHPDQRVLLLSAGNAAHALIREIPVLRSIDLRGAVFAAGVLGCMAFGSAQAFASAKPAADGSICNDNVCTAVCISKGYQYGICYSDRGCVCYRLYE
jgi:hypothetical protein